MAITNFVPQIWSAQILVALRKMLVFGQPGLINRDYEGDIAHAGATVKITAFSAPTIGTYTKDTDITVQTLTDSTESLTIDQQKYFAFEVDDVDRRQALPGIADRVTSDAGYGLADTADQYLAALMAAGVAAGAAGIGNPDGFDNRLGSVTLPLASPDNAYDDVVVPLRAKLNKAKVPTQGRFLVVPTDVYSLLLRDSRFIKVNESGTDQGLRNGIVGRMAGFDVYESQNVPDTDSADSSSSDDDTGVFTVIAGHPMATTFAEQIISVEAYRVEKRFADAVKGLHVYAGKVVRSAALATAHVTVG